ncbi:hypothetical protein [Spirosoma pollinicola]|uniref:Uncharacterized protein n=1 Tax=Spirosoma pollinicola TaxID=2057025 RepID=A0A2K8Z120_9BACT|nr:hypothetical protein [Spirosoma pollinicola]AUD03514.1 hypothetical protein CWM47_17765 [Spirosoma pollinicola]
MESEPQKEFIRQLADEWVSVELPGLDFDYADCIKIIGGLLTATQNQQRTSQIFTAILDQAVELGKSSLWVEREVKFEILAHSIGREELLALELRHAPVMDDRVLDLYNERTRRFSSAT